MISSPSGHEDCSSSLGLPSAGTGLGPHYVLGMFSNVSEEVSVQRCGTLFPGHSCFFDGRMTSSELFTCAHESGTLKNNEMFMYDKYLTPIHIYFVSKCCTVCVIISKKQSQHKYSQ